MSLARLSALAGHVYSKREKQSLANSYLFAAKLPNAAPSPVTLTRVRLHLLVNSK